jgi:hypothetical protein
LFQNLGTKNSIRKPSLTVMRRGLANLESLTAPRSVGIARPVFGENNFCPYDNLVPKMLTINNLERNHCKLLNLLRMKILPGVKIVGYLLSNKYVTSLF